jgi:hypothetical protein
MDKLKRYQDILVAYLEELAPLKPSACRAKKLTNLNAGIFSWDKEKRLSLPRQMKTF